MRGEGVYYSLQRSELRAEIKGTQIDGPGYGDTKADACSQVSLKKIPCQFIAKILRWLIYFL